MSRLITMVKDAGVVGAGGAGFPTHVKLNGEIKTLIINAVECEPLLQVDKHLMKHYATELMLCLGYLMDELGIEKTIIGIKNKYMDIISILEEAKTKDTVHIKPLPNVYPMGDEVVLIKETTGIDLKRSELPITRNLLVMNVESVFNIYKKVFDEENVTQSYVTVVGEVDNPGTYKLPIGTSMAWVLDTLCPPKVKDYEVVVGGPMTGDIASSDEVVKKTTKAFIVLKKDHNLIRNLEATGEVQLKRIMASCSQCRACTDLCPRHLLGHQVEPHKLMNAMANGLTGNYDVLRTALGCVNCGVCELYACHHDLAPRKMMVAVKAAYAKEGIRPTVEGSIAPHADRDFRKVPSARLVMHLNLSKYDEALPFMPDDTQVPFVKIPLSQHIGAPSKPIVTVGEMVEKNQLIAKIADKQLGANIHTGISGLVTEVTAKYIKVERA